MWLLRASVLVSLLLPAGANAGQSRPAGAVPPAPPPAAMIEDAYRPPSPDTFAGRFEARCVRGRPHLFVGPHDLGTSPYFFECGGEYDGLPILVGSRSFPTGEQLLLVLAQESGVANNGAVIYVRRGSAPKLLPIEYLTEFGRISAPDRLVVASGGITDINCGTQYSSAEITIDWTQAPRIVRHRELSRDANC
ncbi:MAG: hypothetical protein QOD42_3561 [Sphingomonadales bacterium]|jgi:hypothetical protein|nr:hypothetical protein [Sphingomonadales bacterium]